MTTEAYWAIAPGRGEIRSEPLPARGPGDVLVHTLYTGISRGTEALVAAGAVPPSEYARMRAPFQAGEFPFPVKYGYINVGRVAEGPDDLRGRTVFSLVPHQRAFVVPAAAVQPLPEGVPPGRAVLAANLETAINGVWDSQPQVGDRVVIVGGGTVGCLVAWLIGRIPGVTCTLADPNPARAAVAATLGVKFAHPDAAPGEADLVIHTSGNPAGLTLAIELAGDEAKVVEMSWYGDRTVTLPLGADFHARRLTLRSSQVGQVPPWQRSRWDYARRMRLALSLLVEPALDVLITGESDFADMPTVLPRLAAAPGDTISHRIRYQPLES